MPSKQLISNLAKDLIDSSGLGNKQKLKIFLLSSIFLTPQKAPMQKLNIEKNLQ